MSRGGATVVFGFVLRSDYLFASLFIFIVFDWKRQLLSKGLLSCWTVPVLVLWFEITGFCLSGRNGVLSC